MDWVMTLIVMGLLGCVVVDGCHQESTRQSRMMKDCIADGKKDYECHHMIIKR